MITPEDDKRVTYFACTHTRGHRDPFGIRAIDRGKHMYVIGKTGMGKSTMLENLAIQDIQNGEGIAFIDPHGSTAEKLLEFVPKHRIKDVVYFAPFDIDYPIGFNVMEDVGYDRRHLVVSGLMGAFKRIWVDAWSARMEYILQNALLALLEYPGSTLLDINKMLVKGSKDNPNLFQQAVIDRITDPIVKAFWTEEFAAFTDTYTREATPAIQNKVGQFISNPLIRHICGQSTSSFDLRKIMDEKKIFIVNLSKGRMGESNAALLGSMLTVKIYLAAMSRADEPPSRLALLPRFYFFVDEFQSMMNDSFADILSEARKYKLALTLANQYIEQMEEKVRNAVFGNVGTLICFRVGPFDAEVLKTVFEPTFEAEDLVNLGLGQIYLTLMIDGVGTEPFSAATLPPIEKPNIVYTDDVLESSRAQFGRRRADVEQAIADRQASFSLQPKKRQSQSYLHSLPRVNSRTNMPHFARTDRYGDDEQSTRNIREQKAGVDTQDMGFQNRDNSFSENKRPYHKDGFVARHNTNKSNNSSDTYRQRKPIASQHKSLKSFAGNENISVARSPLQVLRERMLQKTIKNNINNTVDDIETTHTKSVAEVARPIVPPSTNMNNNFNIAGATDKLSNAESSKDEISNSLIKRILQHEDNH